MEATQQGGNFVVVMDEDGNPQILHRFEGVVMPTTVPSVVMSRHHDMKALEKKGATVPEPSIRNLELAQRGVMSGHCFTANVFTQARLHRCSRSIVPESCRFSLTLQIVSLPKCVMSCTRSITSFMKLMAICFSIVRSR